MQVSQAGKLVEISRSTIDEEVSQSEWEAKSLTVTLGLTKLTIDTLLPSSPVSESQMT